MGFDIFPADVRIARDGVNVQLERISARLLDLPRVSQPAAKRAAVEAPDDWDIDRRFRLGNVLEIRFRPNLELGTNRKIGQRFRVNFPCPARDKTPGRGDRDESALRKVNGTRPPQRRRLPFV